MVDGPPSWYSYSCPDLIASVLGPLPALKDKLRQLANFLADPAFAATLLQQCYDIGGNSAFVLSSALFLPKAYVSTSFGQSCTNFPGSTQ